MKTFLKRLAYCLGGLALLLILFHLVENWRGKRAWNQWKQARLAVGDSYDPARLVPPEVPDADNFGAAPIIADANNGQKYKASVFPSALSESRALGSWREGQRADLSALKEKLKVTDWNQFLNPFETELAALAEAARRPGCRLLKTYAFPDTEVHLLLGMRGRARILSLRALIALQEKRNDAALEDIHTGLRVAAHFQKEPHLLSQLLRGAWVNILMQPIWEGLQDKRWNEDQLAELQARLAEIDLIDSYRRSLEYERLGMTRRMETVASSAPWSRPNVFDLDSNINPIALVAQRICIPSGWIYQNLLRTDRGLANHLDLTWNADLHRVRVSAHNAAVSSYLTSKRTPFDFLYRGVLPALVGQNLRMARAQSGLDMAVIACALERHRLAKGDYPATLEALAPAYLPKAPLDVLEGQPLKYAIDGKTFRLYSCGWNLTDEGGQIGPRGSDGNLDLEKGDWVWGR